MGWRVLALRYAVAKSEREVWVCGRFWIRLKLGKRRAVVVLGVVLLGREEAVMRTFVKGWRYFVSVSVRFFLERKYRIVKTNLHRIPVYLFLSHLLVL